jgi:hypothetical protein
VTALPALPLAAAAWGVAGLGMGIAYSTATLAVIEAAEPGGEGAASAAVQLAEALGVATGTGIAGALVALSAGGQAGLAPGILFADLLMLMVIVLAIIAARRMRAHAPAEASTTSGSGLPEHGPALSP